MSPRRGRPRCAGRWPQRSEARTDSNSRAWHAGQYGTVSGCASSVTFRRQRSVARSHGRLHSMQTSAGSTTSESVCASLPAVLVHRTRVSAPAVAVSNACGSCGFGGKPIHLVCSVSAELWMFTPRPSISSVRARAPRENRPFGWSRVGRAALAVARSVATLPCVRSGWVLFATAVVAFFGASASSRGRLAAARRPTRRGRISGRTASTTRRRRTSPSPSRATTGSSFMLAWTTDGLATARRAAERRHHLVSGHELRPRQHRLAEHAASELRFRFCARRSGQCGNSLASAYYNVIWGSRAPVLAEPLLAGLSWSTTGARAERRLEPQRLRGYRVHHRARVSAAGRCREDPLADHTGRRARRPVRKRRAHDLVGLRRRSGEDRVPACGRELALRSRRRSCRRRTRRRRRRRRIRSTSRCASG